MTETRNRPASEVRDEILAKRPELAKAYEEGRPAYLVARELIRARNRLGLTQAEVADRAGKPASVVSRLERMETMPTLRTVNEIADALGMRLELRFVPRPAEGSVSRTAPEREVDLIREILAARVEVSLQEIRNRLMSVFMDVESAIPERILEPHDVQELMQVLAAQHEPSAEERAAAAG